MDSSTNQLTFNPRTAGSHSVTASSGHTMASNDDTDLDMSHPPNSATEYSHSGSYAMNSNQTNSKSFWNQTVAIPGYPSFNAGLGNLMASPQLDDQGIQLPSFISNSIYAGNQETFKTEVFPPGMDRTPFISKDFSMNSRRVSVKEPSVSPLQPFINQYGASDQISGNSQKKKAPYSGSFNPRMAIYEGRATSSETKTSSHSGSNNFLRSYNAGPQGIDINGSESLEVMGIELSYKTQINKAMYEKLTALSVDSPALTENETALEVKESMKVPQNFYQLFRDLTHTLNERTQELEETKSLMEAILVSLVMTKDTAITTNGTFDAQDLAHKITNKMSVLQSENEALLQMVSHSNKQSLVVELGILKSENQALREKLKTEGLQV